MGYFSYTGLILLLPLAGFGLLGLFGKKYLHRFSGAFGSTILLTVTVLSFYTAWQYFFVYGKVNGIYQPFTVFHFTWLQFSPGLSIDLGILLDPISVMMILLISFVSLMVHLFSLGYMKGEKRFSTYFAFLSLFTFSMLGLVLSGNIFQLYIFWELVGISSYLLIGFYFDKPSAVAASKKAFIVTRFADMGLLIGILLLAYYAESLDFHTLINNLTSVRSQQSLHMVNASFLGVSMLTWGLVLVFVGGAGKSAMFPLHIWLPDAMEGPTPVSALIHAATMVVAGVYLVARLFPLYIHNGTVLHIIAYVGAFSAMLAALIACTQTDIKRVLAYSTISQIGYMMMSLGVSGFRGDGGLGYMASMFHLFTHAFFKSLLFLGAGAIIHFVQSNELKDMGGLRRLMPVTHICFLVGCLAISGIPPFSGFFSKEEILMAAYQTNVWIYAIGLFTSLLTAFYMFRLYFSIFHHKETGLKTHHSEAPLSMKFPLIILAICSLFAGLIDFPSLVNANGTGVEERLDLGLSVIPVSLSLVGIYYAFLLYRKENDMPEKMSLGFGKFYGLVVRKFYFDELYLFVTKKIIFNLVGRPAAWFDKHIVDGSMNLLAAGTTKFSERIKGFQSGKLQQYTLYFFAGIAGLVVLFVYWKKW
jgi:NADH-quinone oxidoreductase subunit L